MGRARIDAFLAGGLSQKARCEQQGFKANQLGYWLRKRNAPNTPSTSRWVSLETSNHFNSGVSMRIGSLVVEVEKGFDQGVLADVIRTFYSGMLSSHPRQRVYLAVGATDLRKVVDGLAAIVQLDFQLNPFDLCLFAFCNRQRNRVKILEWSERGFWLHYFRLDQGKLPWPQDGEEFNPLDVTWQDLRLLHRLQ